MGGISKSEGQLNLIAKIQRLDLNPSSPDHFWKPLEVELNEPLCDIGLLDLENEQEIIIFGGWNYSSFKTIEKLKIDDDPAKIHKVVSETLKELPKNDFFIVNGVEIRDEN